MLTHFYVYAFLRKDNSPYYVGKGFGKRAFVRHRKGVKPPKDLSKIVFLRKNLSEEQAFEWEKFYIAHYGRKDLGTGILRNLTDGGEGVSNPSVSVRQRQREAGKINGKKIHAEKDGLGRSITGLKAIEKVHKIIHAERDEWGRSVLGVKSAERLHAKRDELGRSIAGMQAAARTNSQKWEDPDHPELGQHHFNTLKRLQRENGYLSGRCNRQKVR
jgi:hypothetical protein